MRWREDFHVSQTRWDSTVAELVTLGLAETRGKGVGATIEGRNLASGLEYAYTNPYAGKTF